ncbi:hypothetical protein [Desulfobacula sp.]|uniref:hypothetical protein n=1 Tax=Desulfobacula sp. TaxID=2593537 RepID=UPI00260E7621|nr:hypothetical protein [Desulfobacula sp.]
MASLPEQLQSLISSSGILADLDGQIGSITSAASTLSNLINSPPEEIDDLIKGLSNISLTNIRLPDNFISGFSGISDVIPTDFNSITGGLDSVLSGINNVLDVNVLTSIQAFIQCLETLSVLIEMDFSRFQFTASGSPPASLAEASESPTSSSAAGGPAASEPLATGNGGSEGGAEDSGSQGSGTAEANAGASVDASASGAVVATKNISALVGAFPTPFNAENAVGFFRDVLKGIPRDNVNMSHVPVYDDVFLLLNTGVGFSEMDSSGIQTHIQNTLTSLTTALDRDGLKPVHDLSKQVNDILVKIDFNELGTQSIQVASAMEEIATGLEANDITGMDDQLRVVDTSLDILLPLLDSLRDTVLENELVQLNQSLSKLSSGLNQSMLQLQRLLKPPATADFFVIIDDLIQQGIHQSGIQELTKAAENLFKQMTDMLALLNTSVVKDALSAVTNSLGDALDTFDSAMLQVTSTVSAVFDDVQNALDLIDTVTFQESVENALQEIHDTIKSVIDQLFTPIRTAVTSAVDLIESAVDSFHPEQIKATIQDMIDQMTAIFSSQEVMDAIHLIKSTIETITEQLQAASFTPVVDGVVTGIDGVKDVFQLVPSSLLSDDLKQQIQTAINALPQDLEQPIHTLTSELDNLIEEGPKALLLQLQEPVKSLAAQLNEISPDKLIGNDLFKEYDNLLKDLADFTPSTVLTPIQTALTHLKEEISRQIDLVTLLKPVEDLYDGMAQQLTQLDPSAIVEPINNKINEMTTSFLDILPEESVFEILEKIVSGLESARAIVTEIKSLVDTLTGMVTELANPEAQLTQWLQPVLDQVDNLPEIPGIDITLNQMSQNVDTLKKTGIMSQISQAVTPLQTALDTLDPQTIHPRLLAAYGRLNPSAIDVLPPGPQKTALLSIRGRFNPVSPPVNLVFGKLRETQTGLQTTLSNTENLLADWEDRFFGTDSSFRALQLDNPTSQTVKDMMKQSIQDHTIKPISNLFSSITTAFSAFDGPVNRLQGFVDAMDDLFSDIVEGPGSLGEIQTILAGMVDRIRNLNLDFLEQELKDVFTAVKQKFNDINPKPLRESLQTLLDNTLALIDVEQVLPHAEVQAIDHTYAETLLKLGALNPDTLISEVVQPAFDEKIEPILTLFDLTDPIAVLLERMDGLAEELDIELNKVDTAYQGMMQAVPI